MDIKLICNYLNNLTIILVFFFLLKYAKNQLLCDKHDT